MAIGLGPGEGWVQFGELALALVLGSAIGLERELRQKSAGMRTNALVGLGACLFMLISKYGFGDVLHPGTVILDPSRVAAQIVTGIGFIGGGLIFVRRDIVRGLTTAAVVWLTAAVGAAAGAGLPLLAVAVTGGHFVVIYGYTPLVHRLQGQGGLPTQIRVRYSHASGALRRVIALCTQGGFTVMELSVERDPSADDAEGGPGTHHRAGTAQAVDVLMILSGRGSVPDLVTDLSSVPGVLAVTAGVDESGSESL